MPRLQRRDKVISIRLSGDEYDQFAALCSAEGADSISELARRGMKLLLLRNDHDRSAAIDSRLHEIDVRVTVLDREVARLVSLMGIDKLQTVPCSQGSGQVAG